MEKYGRDLKKDSRVYSYKRHGKDDQTGLDDD